MGGLHISTCKYMQLFLWFKVIQILESGKFFPGVLGFGICNLAQRIRNLINDWNAESLFPSQAVVDQYPLVLLLILKLTAVHVITFLLSMPFHQVCSWKLLWSPASYLEGNLNSVSVKYKHSQYIMLQLTVVIMRSNFIAPSEGTLMGGIDKRP